MTIGSVGLGFRFSALPMDGGAASLIERETVPFAYYTRPNYLF